MPFFVGQVLFDQIPDEILAIDGIQTSKLRRRDNPDDAVIFLESHAGRGKEAPGEDSLELASEWGFQTGDCNTPLSINVSAEVRNRRVSSFR